MVLVNIKLEEQFECSVATAIMIMQRVLMAWRHEAGCELQLSHAFLEESKNETTKSYLTLDEMDPDRGLKRLWEIVSYLKICRSQKSGDNNLDKDGFR